MIVLAGELEAGYEATLEHLIWRQLKGAYGVALALAPHDHASLEQALAAWPDHERVFLIPPGRTAASVAFGDFCPPAGDVVYVFGRPGNNLVRLVAPGETVVSLHTPHPVELMAVSVAAIVLQHVCR